MTHSIAQMMLAKTGHENKAITGSLWLRRKYNDGKVHSNGKVSFSIPEDDHNSVRAQYFAAKKAETLTKLWAEVGRKYGQNGGTPNSKTVADYIRQVVVPKGGKV